MRCTSGSGQVRRTTPLSSRAELRMSTALLRHHDEAALRRLVPGYQPLAAEDFDTHHGSLWFVTKDGLPVEQRLPVDAFAPDRRA